MIYQIFERLRNIYKIKQLTRESILKISSVVNSSESTPLIIKYAKTKILEIENKAVNNITGQINSLLIPFIRGTKHNEIRRPKRFSKNVIDILNESFAKSDYPSYEEKIKLANLCLVTLRQVNSWFINKRNRMKKLHNKDFFDKY
ncbi:HD1 [Hepatospora eriocheir]|uniref:HD1 n=1 Tax=Hepatospora eriocheir TaxID=1081669 RepID=A0A1X0QCY4_9MICR|nr:HD1 [Hepatospora eriocheir]